MTVQSKVRGDAGRALAAARKEEESAIDAALSVQALERGRVARAQAPTIVRRVRPHESGLWSRRYCEVEESIVTTTQQATNVTTTRRGLRWDEAVCELRVPLRALLALARHRVRATA